MKFSDAGLNRSEQPTAILQVQDQSAYASSLQIRTSGDPLTISAPCVKRLRRLMKVAYLKLTSLREQLEGTCARNG